jgi:exopolyphosphatase/guanosine-5'-triphosphate,3'-diphosphate pyrophosphatase
LITHNDLGDGSLNAHGLDDLRARLVDAGHPARLRLAGLLPAQAIHLAGGVAILVALVEELGLSRLLPMQAGLRAGAMWDLHRRGMAGAGESGRCA